VVVQINPDSRPLRWASLGCTTASLAGSMVLLGGLCWVLCLQQKEKVATVADRAAAEPLLSLQLQGAMLDSTALVAGTVVPARHH